MKWMDGRAARTDTHDFQRDKARKDNNGTENKREEGGEGQDKEEPRGIEESRERQAVSASASAAAAVAIVAASLLRSEAA